MTELTPDEILAGLRALVTRSQNDAEALDDPVPLDRHGPPAPQAAPHFPPAFDLPGRALAPKAANAPVPPDAVRFKGL